MFDGKDSITIEGISMGQYLTEITYGYFDTWSSDTGYTLSNKFTGTFKGTVPKWTLKFRPLTTSEITYLTTNIFRKTLLTVVYKDASGVSKTFYAHKGDLELNYFHINMSKAFTYEIVGNNPL